MSIPEPNVDLVLKVEKISKHFGGIQALDQVDFELKRGEVHALMGENGAGKSTLAKIISGIIQKDSGSILFEGKEVHFVNTQDAMEKGIAIVLQEFNLIPDLNVAENVFLNRSLMYRRNVIPKSKRMFEETTKLLTLFGMEKSINPTYKVKTLTIAEMQIVEVLKAVSLNAKVIILDEPTAALSQNEVDKLFAIINRLKKQGVSFIIVSHRLDEIYAISDRITVFRDGKLISQNNETVHFDRNNLIKAMVGRDIQNFYGEGNRSDQREQSIVLKVENLSDTKNFVKNISFVARKGEILGVSGLVGAGRSEMVRCLFGIDRRSTGIVKVNDKKVKPNSPKASIQSGIALVPEDRKNDGLILNMNILENTVMSDLGRKTAFFLNTRNEKSQTYDMTKKLKLKYGSLYDAISHLSGGNQQKVLVGKWLLLNPEILIIDEPTRGIDISAKTEIYNIIRDLADHGVCILIVSSELPEILGLCDRILVMKQGELVKELDRRDANQETIMSYATLSQGGTLSHERG